MKRLLLALVVAGLLTVGVTAASADPPPNLGSSAPAAVTGGPAAQAQVPATAQATIGWSVYFGAGYGYAPVIPSNRNPAWTVTAGNPYLVFQSDCNLVLYSTSGGGAFWASNTVANLRPCTLSFQADGNVVIRNQPGQVGWATGVVHSGAVHAAMALYDSGCLVEYYYNAAIQQWQNAWRTNLTGIGINCAAYTA